jgi:hypothetical protein
MRKYPRINKEIFERYILEYITNGPRNMDHIELLYYASQYSNLVNNITKDFTEEEYLNFYQTPSIFILIIFDMFHLSRKTNFILHQYSIDRVMFLQKLGLDPKFPINDFFKSHLFDDKFWSFKVRKDK